MRRVTMMAVVALLGLMLTANAYASMPRACGGYTIADDDPCCISGVVSVGGVPVVGAEVIATHEAAGAEARDVTDYAYKWDPFPTYGFLLDGPELQAEPGDEIVLEVRYQGHARTVHVKVQRGEQWLDIDLAGIIEQ